jgi:LmbE family N-acetylglucosaminyl deacetylase
MNILAFGAHPDDVEFRCAGTLKKYADRGDNIFIAIATNGNIGSFRMTKEETAKTRRIEAQNAADLLGATLIWMGEDDEFLFDTKETRLKFIDAVRVAKPDVIFAPPYMQDYNPDHDITGYLAFIARINASIKLIETEHEPHTKVPAMFFALPFGISAAYSPEYFVDITDTFQFKMDMFLCHASQQGEWCKDAFGVNYAEILERENKALAASCGTPGVDYVEAFMLCKTWPIIAGAYKLLP